MKYLPCQAYSSKLKNKELMNDRINITVVFL